MRLQLCRIKWEIKNFLLISSSPFHF